MIAGRIEWPSISWAVSRSWVTSGIGCETYAYATVFLNLWPHLIQIECFLKILAANANSIWPSNLTSRIRSCRPMYTLINIKGKSYKIYHCNIVLEKYWKWSRLFKRLGKTLQSHKRVARYWYRTFSSIHCKVKIYTMMTFVKNKVLYLIRHVYVMWKDER